MSQPTNYVAATPYVSLSPSSVGLKVGMRYITLKVKTWTGQPTIEEFAILHEQYGCVEEMESDV